MRYNIPVIISIILLALSSEIVSAQDSMPDRRAKAVFIDIDLMGTGPTLNFDMRFKKGTNIGYGARIGFGASLRNKNQNYNIYQLPIGVYFTKGKERIMLETGFRITGYRTEVPYQINSISGAGGDFWKHAYEASFGGNIGMRINPKRTGGVVRIYWGPMFTPGEFPWLFNFGVSAGLGFK